MQFTVIQQRLRHDLDEDENGSKSCDLQHQNFIKPDNDLEEDENGSKSCDLHQNFIKPDNRR